MSIGTPIPSVNPGKPTDPPTSCPRCRSPRIWWPSLAPAGYAPACPWCDDIDEADTIPEPTPLAPKEGF